MNYFLSFKVAASAEASSAFFLGLTDTEAGITKKIN